MRLLRTLRDLPWWSGLIICLIANLLIPFGLFGIIFGCSWFIFGCWIFSKLLLIDREAESGRAIIGFPLTFLMLCLFKDPIQLFWYWDIHMYSDLYIARLIAAFPFGLITSQGFNVK